MALTVEDGTGKADATSYVALADANAYFLARDPNEEIYTGWAGLDDAGKEAALIRATQALDSWFRGRWKGTKKTSAQALAWPRIDVVDEEGLDVADTIVPTPVKRAICEIASIEATSRYIQETVTRDNMVKSVSVGPISTTYMEGATSITQFPHIDALLKGLASAGGTQLGMNIGLTAEELSDDSDAFDPFDYPAYFELRKFGG